MHVLLSWGPRCWILGKRSKTRHARMTSCQEPNLTDTQLGNDVYSDTGA
jgi:hypothetical protein